MKQEIAAQKIRQITEQSDFIRRLAEKVDGDIMSSAAIGIAQYSEKITGSSRLCADIKRLRRELLVLQKQIDNEY